MKFCFNFVSFFSSYLGNESVVSPSYSDAGLRAYLEHPLTSTAASTGDATTVKETPSLLYDFNKFAVSTNATSAAGAGVATSSSSSAVVAGSSTASSSGITELVVLAPRSQGATMATVGR